MGIIPEFGTIPFIVSGDGLPFSNRLFGGWRKMVESKTFIDLHRA
jgi:hypothetical protein